MMLRSSPRPKGRRLWRVLAGTGLVLFAGFVLLAILSEDDRPMNFIADASQTASGEGMTRTGRFFRGHAIASDPVVISDGGRYRMFYTDLEPNKNRTVIAMATSADGLTWTPVETGHNIPGAILVGRDAEWDQNLESAEAVATDDGLLLFFAGYRDQGTPMKGFPAAIWAARSKDGGKRFERVSSAPVLAPSKGWFDNDAAYSPAVLRVRDGYIMLYVGHAYTDLSRTGGVGGVSLLGATSPDGLSWTKLPKPIFQPGAGPEWMKDGMAEPDLVAGPDGRYYLFFTGLKGEERRIGLATGASPTGPWTIRSAPLLLPGPKGSPDGHQVLAPTVLIENDRLRMWYLAADGRERLSIGLGEQNWSRLTR